MHGILKKINENIIYFKKEFDWKYPLQVNNDTSRRNGPLNCNVKHFPMNYRSWGGLDVYKTMKTIPRLVFHHK